MSKNQPGYSEVARLPRTRPMTIFRKLPASIRITAIAVTITVASTSFAQQPTSSEPGPSVEQLKPRLEKLRLELKEEQAAQAQRAELNTSELSVLRDKRKQLADRLLTAQAERERNADRLKTLQEQAEYASLEATQLINEAATITSAVDSAAEQLRVHLKEIPGSAAAIEQLTQSAEALNWAEESEPSSALVDALDRILAEFDKAHKQALTITVRHVSIFTAGGKQEEVKLLSLGHVRFAYQTIDAERVGLALASPREASGYRWAEDLGGGIEGQIRDAIKAVESRKASLLAVPIDPTGRVEPDMINNDSSLGEKIRSGGLVMWPLAGLALVAFALIGERLSVFYGRNGHGDRLAAKVMNACNERNFERALEICKRGRGTVSHVLEACLRRRMLGQRAMEDSVQEQMLHELPRLNRFMGGIATLAAVAPLLGLLGTVTGIIRTFGVIRAFGNANPSLMAGGISEALLTTATGLVIAVPILIVHSVLRGRSERIVADAERHAAMLLMSLVHDSDHETLEMGDANKHKDRSNKSVGSVRAASRTPGNEQETAVG